ncbi:transglutaminase-like domain-containing protein [Microbacterium trichothecenolyticum]|uniref:Transglutaminase-like putative cysteine protease n=1 Tax=Microbacterium trichothecenolyticum TaxID=69370 RepID=A0ABU0TYH5_MICTR|nr:transglutaminase-like domain-containing protein [Microbacterium trichothecenolyticum]MDQ1124711.1 transglutaminase-like putative cysteine protease [Microbacterium trichothecenolyticum]
MTRRWAVDAAVMLALCAVALVPLSSAYGDVAFWVAGGGGLLVGAAIAVVAAVRRWAVILVAAALVVAYFLVGGALVFPSRSLLGFVPTVDVLVSLATGTVRVWKESVTLPTPFAGVETMSVLPLILGLLAGSIAVSFAVRLRRFALALIVPGALLLASVALSTFDSAFPVAVGALFGAIALGWAVWRSRLAAAERHAATADVPSSSGTLGIVAALTVVAVVGGAATVGAAASSLTPLADRQVVRDRVVPPLELHDYASPLTAFRKYVKDDGEEPLFSVTGLPEGARVRLAALDLYDGMVYSVSGSGSGAGTFARVGRRIAAPVQGSAAHVTVKVGTLSGVWLPTVGSLTAIGFNGTDAVDHDAAVHYNVASSTAVVTTGVAEGDTYEFDAVLPATPSDEQLASASISNVTTPAPERVPDDLLAAMDAAVSGAATPLEQIRAVQAYLQTEGFFSHGLEGEVASRSGHGLAREGELFSQPQMIGDDEQYAVAMALMVSQLGLPVRVVMGFSGENTGLSGGTVDVTGKQLHAWVEVPFDGYGWVPFWATPAEDKVPQQQTPEKRQKPRVQVAQPPDQPQEPAELPPAPPVEDAHSSDRPADLGWLWGLLQVTGWSLAAVALLFGPSIVLGALRARRRRGRARAADAVERVGGGWAELIDTARDAGAPIRRGATRREQGAALDERFPETGAGALAVRADAAVFGAGTIGPDEVEAYWADVASASRGLGRSLSWRRRVRARLFPTSVWVEVRARLALGRLVRGGLARGRSLLGRVLRAPRKKEAGS